MPDTLLINLFGGPGSGKSTTAAEIYAALKNRGMRVELVREFIKEWAWEGKPVGPLEQMQIFVEQSRREHVLFGKLDVLVTDSPLLVTTYYGSQYDGLKDCMHAMQRVHDSECEKVGVRVLNLSLERTDHFDDAGRYHTLEESKNVDAHLEDLLADLSKPFVRVPTGRGAVEFVLETIDRFELEKNRGDS